MMREHRTWRARRAAAALLALTLVATACGEDDEGAGSPVTTDDSDPTTTGSTTSVATDTTEPDTTEPVDTSPGTSDDTTAGDDTAPADVNAFCDAAVAAETAVSSGPDVDFENATQQEIEEAMAEFSGALSPLLDDLTDLAPEDIADEVAQLDETIRSGLETGEDPFGDPEFAAADRAVDEFLMDHCDFEIQTVRAAEYEFVDAPDELTAGTYGFEFENEGNEVHEMIMFRINDDIDASVEELLEMPEEEAQSMATFVGAAFAAPDESDAVFLDLEPGRYAIVCFIPIGTTSMEMLEGSEGSEATGDAETGGSEGTGGSEEPGGAPHFTQGMVHEFQVT